MAAPKKAMDNYANKMYGTATESVAGTLKFSEINTNVSVFDKAAFVLHRLEWFISLTDLEKIIGAGDGIYAALTSSQNITSLGLDNPAVIDLFQLTGDWATVVGFQLMEQPFVRNFDGLPGGGLIIAPRPLFVAVQGVSLASAVTVKLRAYFTVKQLSAEEYLELVDFYRIVGV